MIFWELLVALFVAFLVAFLLVLTTRKQSRGTGMLWVFLIIFPATLAGGIWARPFGPTLCGIHWLNFLVSGVVSAMFLAVSIPQAPPRGRHETLKMLERIEQEKKLKQITYSTLSSSFWILLASLVVVIVIRYATK